MATETKTYERGDNPQTICDWIRSRGGRAVLTGVTMVDSPMKSQGIVFDTGYNSMARLLVVGDKLSYDTVTRLLTISLGINL